MTVRRRCRTGTIVSVPAAERLNLPRATSNTTTTTLSWRVRRRRVAKRSAADDASASAGAQAAAISAREELSAHPPHVGCSLTGRTFGACPMARR